MSGLPHSIHFSHHFDHPMVEEGVLYVPSVSVTLFLLLLAYLGGFSSSALLRIGDISNPRPALEKGSFNVPFIVYDGGKGEATKSWVTYSNTEYRFTIKIPTNSDSVRFIDRPHTVDDYAMPFAVSFLIEYADLSSFDQYKNQLTSRGYQLVKEQDLTLSEIKSKQYDFMVDASQVEVFTLVPLRGKKHLVFSYLYSPRDEVVERREQLMTILETLEVEK